MKTLESLRTRLVTADDEAFLRYLYACGRADELERAGFSSEQRDMFCAMQFHARNRHYATHHADAEDSLLLIGESMIGRELIDRSGAQCCLVDIALLPAYQNRGIGSARLRQLIERSERDAQTVLLHVDRSSRAQHLYTRHGFTVVADDGVYLQMVRSATAD